MNASFLNLINLKVDVTTMKIPDTLGILKGLQNIVFASISIVELHSLQHFVGHHDVVDVLPTVVENLVAHVWVRRSFPVGMSILVVRSYIVQIDP